MMYRKTIAEIDLQAIRSNYEYACRIAPESRSIAVVKADAYGHGAVQVCNALQDLAPAFAVGMIDEAAQLREHGIQQDILVLEGASTKAGIEAAIELNLWLVVHHELQLASLLETDADRALSIWLKIDTGMNRIGFPVAELAPILTRIREASIPDERIVLCTHLACAEELGGEMTTRQLAKFRECTDGTSLPLSISNSAGILGWRETHANWNRPGYMLYGNSPFADNVESAQALIPAMNLRSELISIRHVDSGESVGYGATWVAERPSLIGTVAIGYADGYPRTAKNGTPVLLRGQKAPLAGRVSMDMITIDLTDIPEATIGDSVLLWGDGLPVNDVARYANTSGYELLSRPTARVPRQYKT